MSERHEHCECGEQMEKPAGEPADLKCPRCGRSMPKAPVGDRAMKDMLSDSALEATCEVMAEEGAIWSGAR